MNNALWNKLLNENTLVTEGISPKMLRSYLTALLDNTDYLGDSISDAAYEPRNIDKKSINQAKKDLNKFFTLAKDYIQPHIGEERMAYDFGVHRTINSSGLDDSRIYKYAHELTDIADKFGRIYPYVDEPKRGSGGPVRIDTKYHSPKGRFDR